MGLKMDKAEEKALQETPVEYLNKESLIEKLELKLESLKNSYRLMPDDLHYGRIEACETIIKEIKGL